MSDIFTPLAVNARRLFGRVEMKPGAPNQRDIAVLTFQSTLWRRFGVPILLLLIVSVVGNVLMFYRYTPARALVTVGKTVIRTRDYQTQLDAAAGRPVLTRMVFSELVKQAGAKAHVTPTPAEIDARLAERQRHGLPAPDDPAAFRDGLVLDMTLENLRIAGVPASDAEIADFYRRNARALTLPAQTRCALVVTPSEMLSQQAAAQLRQGKSGAEIAADPDMHVDGQGGYRVNLAGLPPALQARVRATVQGLPPDRIMTLPLGGAFLTLKCLARLPQTLPPLSQCKDEIARLVKLQKAPSADVEMARLYQANLPDFDIGRYAAYFTGIENANVAMPKTAAPARAVKTALAR